MPGISRLRDGLISGIAFIVNLAVGVEVADNLQPRFIMNGIRQNGGESVIPISLLYVALVTGNGIINRRPRMTLPQIPSVMHLTEEYIDRGDAEEPLSCPVALLLNDAIEGDWTAYAGLSCSYIFPSQENAIEFDEFIESINVIDEMDMVEQLGGHRLIHEDRIQHWIGDFDDGEDMYTCHIFWQDDSPEFLYMNRTGRNKQTEDVND